MPHNKTQTLAKRVLVLATSLLLVPTLALAVPGQVTQQGRLVDASGDGLTGSHTIAFSLFSDSAGSTSVWSEQHTIEADEGYYSVVLGADSSNPLDDTVLSLAPLYLGMTVDGGTLMQPLLEVNSAPYSILSGTAENLDGGYADANALYIDGDLVVDGNGDWVGNVLPGSLPVGCADDEGLRYTAASGWECFDAGSHYTGAQAITAMGAEANSNSLNHARYTNAEAVSAVGAHTTDTDTQLDEAAVDAFVANNGYSTGNHTTDTNTQLDEAAVDGFVANNGYLAPDSSGNVAVGGSGTGNRTLTVRADTNSVASIEAYGFGGSQGSGQLYAGQSALHGGGIMYNGDGTPTMEGQTDHVSFFRRSEGIDHEVMKFPHNSNTVTFTGDATVEGMLIQGTSHGTVSRQVASYFTNVNSSSQYIHIRTPFDPTVASEMFHFEVKGYAYNASTKVVDITYVGYAYQTQGLIRDTGISNPTGGHAPAIYQGSDNNVYLRFKPSNTYYLSFRVDSMQVGNGRVVLPGEVTVIRSSSSTL
jgi:hypothetical protein